MKFIKDILTENDGITWCGARVAAFLALFSFIGLAGYDYYIHQIFHIAEYGSGLMSVLGGAGALIGAKQFSGGK